jgi:hypothetical protein
MSGHSLTRDGIAGVDPKRSFGGHTNQHRDDRSDHTHRTSAQPTRLIALPARDGAEILISALPTGLLTTPTRPSGTSVGSSVMCQERRFGGDACLLIGAVAQRSCMKLSSAALLRGDFLSFLIGRAAFIIRDFCTECMSTRGASELTAPKEDMRHRGWDRELFAYS